MLLRCRVGRWEGVHTSSRGEEQRSPSELSRHICLLLEEISHRILNIQADGVKLLTLTTGAVSLSELTL